MNYPFAGSIFLMLFASSFLCAQSEESLGARAIGMATTSVTTSDEWAAFNNIAGLASQKKIAAGLCYQNEYALPELRKSALTISSPLLKGATAVSFYKTGDEYFNLNRLSVGYAHKIGLVSLGLQIHYMQYAMQDLGVRKNLVLAFGGIAELVPSRLFFGAHIFNVNQAKQGQELLPITMKAGLSYRPGKKVLLNTEVEKDLLYKPTIKAGLEYALVEQLRIRTGIHTNPFIDFFGAGIRNKLLSLDYAFALHSKLGASHTISLSLFLNKLK